MRRLTAIVFVCVMAAGAMAAENYWTGGAGTSNWMDAGNWTLGLPGTTLDRANLNTPNLVVNIYDGSSASADTVEVGYSNAGVHNTLNLYGSLTVTKNIRLAGQTGTAVGNVGVLNIDGGTYIQNMTNSEATNTLQLGRYGTGTINITNGGVLKANSPLVTSGSATIMGVGKLNIIDGLAHFNGYNPFSQTNAAAAVTAAGTRSLNQIEIGANGVLVFNYDRAIQMQGFIDEGIITASAGLTLQMEVVPGAHANGNLTDTTVITRITAIPEPASMTLLGLGSLIFIKKRR